MASSIITAFSSYSEALIAHAKVLVSESIVSLAIKVSFIFLGAMIILIAVSFFMFGAAKGLSAVWGFEPWFGILITGTFFTLAGFFAFIFISSRARKESSKRKAEQKKAADELSRKVYQIVDVKSWTEEHPFYSTGAAAVAGFTLSGAVASGSSKKDNKSESTEQPSIIPLVLTLAEDVLKDTLIVPFLNEYLKPKDQTDSQKFTQ